MSKGVYGDNFGRNNEQEEFMELKEFTLRELFKYPRSRPVPFTFDLEIEQIEQYMPDGDSKIKGINHSNREASFIS